MLAQEKLFECMLISLAVGVCLEIKHTGRRCDTEHCHSTVRSSIISHVEYPFPPVGIVGAADGKNRRAFLFPD